VKFRGAGQGRLALVAEIVVGELGRRLGLAVPDLVLVEVDPALAAPSPTRRCRTCCGRAPGSTSAWTILPGALGIERPDGIDPLLAARIVWFDALVLNVDRSWRNPNLLRWHGHPWLIDHGAALYLHHDWPERPAAATRSLPGAADHVLLPVAGPLAVAHAELGPLVTADLVGEVVDLVPAEWLEGHGDIAAARAAYVDLLTDRASDPAPWLDPVEVARVARV
jgi:hypothetical protein